MIQLIRRNPDIFRIDIPLPENPLKNLNCYAIQDKGETLLIDTGFHRPECLEAMKEGLSQLNVDWERTGFFLTHLHSDHTGLVYELTKDKNCPIYMSGLDYAYFINSMNGDAWDKLEVYYEKQGMPPEYTKVLRETNPARSFAPSGIFDAIIVEDGRKINVGNYEFTCIQVPGHTPGQMCLYLEEEQIMFTADHILFDITPNITSWLGVSDSLGDYLKSLQKIKRFPMKIALPAHRKNDMDVYERIEEIIYHHKLRLEETLQVLAEEKPLNAYETASRLTWSMRGKHWEEFPLAQRWFAVGETIAHLDYLLQRGMIERNEGKVYTYSLKESFEVNKVRLTEAWKETK